MEEYLHLGIRDTRLNYDGILILATMIRVEQLITEVLQSSHTHVPADYDVGDLGVPFVEVSRIDTLQPHQTNQLIRLLWDDYQYDNDQHYDAYPTLLREWYYITIPHCGKCYHCEVDHFMEGCGYEGSRTLFYG